MKRTLIIGLLLVGSFAHADAAAVITDITSKIPDTGLMITIAASVVEFILRFCKTSKPASLFYTVAAIIKALGSLFTKIGMLLDNVLQNVKPAQFEEVTKAVNEPSV